LKSEKANHLKMNALRLCFCNEVLPIEEEKLNDEIVPHFWFALNILPFQILSAIHSAS